MTVVTKTYPLPPVDEREVLRYAGCRTADEGTSALLRSVLAEAANAVSPRACFVALPVAVSGNVCRLGEWEIPSASLARLLADCREAVVFAATVGVELDRLIAKYSRVSPARAVMLQAFGAERIEALCDAVCADCAGATARFSPGYGDLPLAVQQDIFRLLQPERKIGVCLNDSLLMSPTKSVTAIVGRR
jgi:hypothetical protein